MAFGGIFAVACAKLEKAYAEAKAIEDRAVEAQKARDEQARRDSGFYEAIAEQKRKSRLLETGPVLKDTGTLPGALGEDNWDYPSRV